MKHMTGDQFGRIPEGMKWCRHCNGYGSSLNEASGAARIALGRAS
jgi:hypothetical protein